MMMSREILCWLKRASEKLVEGINTHLCDVLSSQKLYIFLDSCKEYGTLRDAKEVVNKLNLTGHHMVAVFVAGN